MIQNRYTEIIGEILGPTFDKENSDNIAGELTIDLLYAVVYHPIIDIETPFAWSNDLNSKYSEMFLEQSLIVAKFIENQAESIESLLVLSEVQVTQFYCQADSTLVTFEILYISKYTMTVQEVNATELNRARINIKLAAEKQKIAIQKKLRLPNDWYCKFLWDSISGLNLSKTDLQIYSRAPNSCSITQYCHGRTITRELYQLITVLIVATILLLLKTSISLK